jgi:hypothetical protein
MALYAQSNLGYQRTLIQRNSYGSEYFLAQVWTDGQNAARNPLSSKKEMEIASSGALPRTTTIIALAGH